MRVSVRGLTLALALLWGGCVLLVGVINLAVPAYGLNFLQLLSSVYPGFHASRGFADVIVGTVYAIVDGAIGGLVFGWLYNLFVEPQT